MIVFDLKLVLLVNFKGGGVSKAGSRAKSKGAGAKFPGSQWRAHSAIILQKPDAGVKFLKILWKNSTFGAYIELTNFSFFSG